MAEEFEAALATAIRKVRALGNAVHELRVAQEKLAEKADEGDLDPDASNEYHGKIAIAHNDFGKDRINVPIGLVIKVLPFKRYLPVVHR